MKKKMKKTDPTRHWQQGSQLAVAWFHKKQVNMLSTIHEAKMLDIAIWDRHSVGGHRHVKKPECVDWYLSIFHQLTEIGVTNVRVVFASITGNDMPLLEFRRKLLDSLLQRAQWPLGNPRSTLTAAQAAAVHPYVRLNERHFAQQYPDGGKPDCVVCSDRTKGRRKQMSWRCGDCEIPMCPGLCFKRYHTRVHYKIVYSD